MRANLTMINSTVSNNYSVGKGGGFHLVCDSTATIINSTISGNISEMKGGHSIYAAP
jgi:hypothetical protein